MEEEGVYRTCGWALIFQLRNLNAARKGGDQLQSLNWLGSEWNPPPSTGGASPSLARSVSLRDPFQTLEQKLQVKKLPNASLRMNNLTWKNKSPFLLNHLEKLKLTER